MAGLGWAEKPCSSYEPDFIIKGFITCRSGFHTCERLLQPVLRLNLSLKVYDAVSEAVSKIREIVQSADTERTDSFHTVQSLLQVCT